MEKPRDSRRKGILAGLAVVCAGSVLAGVALGSVKIPLREVLRAIAAGPGGSGPQELIVWRLRLPRVLMGLIEGAGLGAAGAVMQAMFRNPMADPYVLGVSSGASLGAVLAIALGPAAYWSLPVFSLVGAAVAALTVYSIATRGGRTDNWTMLLAGISISSLVSALITLIIVLFRQRTDDIVFWTMGGLSRASWVSLLSMLPYTLCGIWLILREWSALNAVSFGDEVAFHLGVEIDSLKLRLFAGTSLVVASTVAFSGPVGFIGLIVPHALRLLIGPDHRYLLPASAVCAGTFLVLADLAARTLVPPMEIPVGAITAVCGAPFFIFLLFKFRGKKEMSL